MNHALVEKKIQFFKDVIQKIILNVQRNKNLDSTEINQTVVNMMSFINETLTSQINSTLTSMHSTLEDVTQRLAQIETIQRSQPQVSC